MGKRHLTLKDRAELEVLYNKGRGVEEIAAKLKVHRSTVYNELKRGDTGEMDSNGRIGYSAELAQQEIINNYRRRRTARAAAEEAEGQAMRTAYYETKCGGLTVERRSRRSRTEAQRRKLVRVRENIGAAMMLLGFLLLMAIGGAEDLTVIFLGGLAGLSLMLLGGWLGHAFYGQEKDAGWLRRERDEDVF